MLLLWDPALLCTYPAAKPYPPSHLSNTTYLIRLMNFGGVSVGLAALLCGDSVTTDYILGGGMWAAGRPVLVAPLTDRGVTVWGGILSQVLLLLNSSNANTHRQARCTSKHTNSYPKLQIFDLAKKKKRRPIELNMIDCDTAGESHKQEAGKPMVINGLVGRV